MYSLKKGVVKPLRARFKNRITYFIKNCNNLNKYDIESTTTIRISSSNVLIMLYKTSHSPIVYKGCRDRVVVGFITTYAISTYHH